ncbi:MAG: hypothetical protein Q8N71_01150 [candidate division Zixibacteria bacterium]|nr:hypothetical protein [candidate division Zixibacteria bacterium]
MRTKIYLALFLVFLLEILNLSILSNQSFAFRLQNYPKDGHFKQLSPDRDPWYFIDENNWYIMGPDKWQHFSGCYIAQKLFSQVTNPYLSAGVVALFGIAKEYDDAYREGWSNRDLLMDLLGIASALNQTKYQFYCSFDSEKIMLNVNFRLR